MKYLGIPFEHYRLSEWAVKSIQAYKDMHFTDDNTDYSKDVSVEQVKAWLYGKISTDYNTPMTEQQINRLSEKQVRTIYNNMQATHNLGSITQIKAEDLAVVDTDKFTYIMTYSYPCQDCSLAGKGAGMAKGSGTRSALLWEVERLLLELKEANSLPQILLLENVPQVHGEKNKDDFYAWISELEEMGYHNYWQDLNAKDYGIPQNRNRCFMVSLLGDYYYSFPKPQKLTVRLKDFLDKKVDEKYYLLDKTVEMFIEHNLVVEPTFIERALTDSNGETMSFDPNQSKTFGYRKPLPIARALRAENNSAGCVIENYRIRKLTERECFRLQGVKEEDFERVAKNQSTSSLYHLAGDSICCTCLMAIFGELFEIDYRNKINELVGELKQ